MDRWSNRQTSTESATLEVQRELPSCKRLHPFIGHTYFQLTSNNYIYQFSEFEASLSSDAKTKPNLSQKNAHTQDSHRLELPDLGQAQKLWQD